jgi:hypothetical protein
MEASSGSSADTYQHAMFRLDPVSSFTPMDSMIVLGAETEMQNFGTPDFSKAQSGTGANRKFSADDYSSPDMSNLEEA